MVPPQFVNFFIASASAGAALVGLLFVAVSVAPEHIVQANAPVERQAMAASSFTALLNAFLISFGALLPENVGYITLVMSLSGLMNSIYLTRNRFKERQKWQSVLRRINLILVSYIVYGFELYSKPSAKAPENHPGDEAPFLVRGRPGERTLHKAA